MSQRSDAVAAEALVSLGGSQPSLVSYPNKGIVMMLDWNQYRQALLKRIGELGKQSPGTLRGSTRSARSFLKNMAYARRRSRPT